MPPKAKPKENDKAGSSGNNSTASLSGAASVSFTFKVCVNVKYLTPPADPTESIFIRVTAPWIDTASAGSVSSANGSYTESVTSKIDKKSFHESPGAYIYAFDKLNNPLGFAYLDCSSLLVDRGTITASGFVHDPLAISLEASITNTNPIIQESKTLEPLHLRIKSLKNFPFLKDESLATACQCTFIYGVIQLADIKRTIFTSINAANTTSNMSSPIVSYSTVLLTNILDSSLKVKEAMSSSSHRFGIFSDNIFSSIFTHQFIQSIAKHLGNKTTLADADHSIIKRFNTVLASITETVSYGSTTFRLDSLLRDAFEMRDGFQRKLADSSDSSSKEFTVASVSASYSLHLLPLLSLL
jgi:hypothetical protein